MSRQAITLIAEDELKKVIRRDRMFKHKEKQAGLVPKGFDSPFGDFPDELKINCTRPSCIIAQPGKINKDGNGVPPPSTGVFKRRPITPTEFRRYYIRGDIPVQILHGTSNRVAWKGDLGSMDYHHLLPLFIDGLREKEDPYRFIAVQGSYDLIENGSVAKVLPVIPQIILPLKKALDTRDPEIIATACKIIQALVMIDGGSTKMGEALVPYYRQLLPTMNLFKRQNYNLNDAFDYKQRKRLCLGDLIEETLQLCERFGGPEAFINIKYMIPTYEVVNI